jgi:hypothetical protein
MNCASLSSNALKLSRRMPVRRRRTIIKPVEMIHLDIKSSAASRTGGGVS